MVVSLASPALGPAVMGLVHRWADDSQQGARRNAMVAATECAQRRAAREEVDDFFAALLTDEAPATSPARRAAHG